MKVVNQQGWAVLVVVIWVSHCWLVLKSLLTATIKLIFHYL